MSRVKRIRTIEEATSWLRDQLRAGPVSSRTLREAFRQHGGSRTTLYRASVTLEVTRTRKGRNFDWGLPR